MSGLTNSLKKTGENVATVVKGIVGKAGNSDTNHNSRWFLGNLALTTVSAAFLSKSAGDDLAANQSIAQDVIVNGNILLDSVNNSNDHFMKSFAETTVFALLVGFALPPLTAHFKSTPFDLACGATLPFLSEGISHVGKEILNRMMGNKKTKKETKEKTKEEKEKNLYKTYGAVGIAGIIKAGIFGYNVMQGSGHTSNAIYAASFFNTLKTGYDTRKAYKNNGEIRDSKNVIGILFDGVVSPVTAFAILGLSEKLNLPNTLASTIAKAVVGGVIASASLKGLTHLLDGFLEKRFEDDKGKTAS